MKELGGNDMEKLELKLKHDTERERAESRRRAEERANQIRPTLNMFPVDFLYVPPELVPDGWEYKWIRLGYFDRPDYENESRCLGKGYTPVPASRHPQMIRSYTQHGAHQVDGCIVKERLMLCEIPKVLIDEVRAEAAKKEYDLVYSLRALESGMSMDPHMPGKIFNAETTMDFGSM